MQNLSPVRATWYGDAEGWVRLEGAEHDRVAGTPAEAELGRARMLGAELDDGSFLAFSDARAVPWRVDIVHERNRLKRCEQGKVLLFDASSKGNPWKPAAMRCTCRLCPRCARARVGRLAHRWVPPLEAAAADGAAVYHLTLTQPTDEADGALVLPSERRRYKGDSGPGVVASAVGGESAAGAYARLRGAFTSVRDDRSTRALWRSALGGYLYGTEFTLRSKAARGAVRPRWHCHMHLLVVVPKPWADFRFTWGELRRTWCEAAGASPNAQHCERVRPREGQGIEDALLEVLKYPLKLAELTVAATIEVYASLRGLRPHHVGGSFHGASEASQGAPWAGWLAARTEPPHWPRLLVRLDRAHPWAPYTGQVREGEAEWTLGSNPWAQASGQVPGVWTADAGLYWAELGRDEDASDHDLVDEDA